jgi:ADP-dependent NAD(P)H-hydrate dehydratase / NAD(P)H-hydrate epimerase
MTLPGWLEPLLTPEALRATDAWAIEARGIPSLELMERAAEGLARAALRRAPEGRIAVVCGKGNNGGDGYAAARLLRGAGRDVDVLAVWDPGELRGDAAEQLRRLPGAPPRPWDPAALDGAALVIDAVLGTGASGAPREPAAAVLAALAEAAAPVLAADVPSGVDAATGEVAGPAVRAVATATFHRALPGLWIAPGKAHAGEVEVVDIGIPAGGPAAAGAEIGLAGPGVLDGMPRREAGSTKFSSGNVVVIGGSRGLTGAPRMSALAAMRSGAGYVTLAVPASLEAPFTVSLLEAMLVPLPEHDGHLGEAALEPVLGALARADAAVLGPGLSRAPEAQALARELAVRIEVPLVIDADGLNALAGRVGEVLGRRSAPAVLTPHAGELGRLLGLDSKEIERRRLHHARAAAAEAGAVVVLKGDDTLVAEPGGAVAVSRGGGAALATAGTGDVLSGVVAAMLAKRMPAPHAAAAGVFAHLRAGQLAAAPHGPDGVIASDVIAALPAALAA